MNTNVNLPTRGVLLGINGYMIGAMAARRTAKVLGAVAKETGAVALQIACYPAAAIACCFSSTQTSFPATIREAGTIMSEVLKHDSLPFLKMGKRALEITQGLLCISEFPVPERDRQGDNDGKNI